MHSLQFWKDWPIVYQRIFGVTAGVFIFSLLFLWFSYFRAPAPALMWEYVEEQQLKEAPVHQFQLGPFDFTIQSDSYLIFERLLGSDLKPDHVSSYVFLGVLIAAVIMLLSVVTTLSRFWFFAGAGMFILFVASLRLEVLQLFGRTDKVFTVAVLLAYVPVSYYLNAVKSSASFLFRLFVLTAITLVFGVLVYFFSGVAKPFLHLSTTGITAAILFAVIFIMMVAHEILAGFIYVVSSAKRPAKSLQHFLVISVIYFINLGLAYANKFHYIDWNFLYINFFLLLTLSALLGIWGFRYRQNQYEEIIAANPFGVYLFLSLGAITFTTIGYFTASANDPGLETINDMIIFSHLGYGIIFLTYVIANFFDVLGNNLPAFKVLYRPARMPYFSFRLGGLIATVAFVFYNTWQAPIHNAFSAYYNATGDLYRTLGNTPLALGFYEKAGTYGFLNHHSNYATANIEAGILNGSKERRYYKRATERRPTEMAFLNYSQTFQRDQNWLEALLVLRDGIEAFPDSGPLKNTQGLIYARLNLLDSAFTFLREAQNSSLAGHSAKTNIIGLAAQNDFKLSSDSLYRMLGSTEEGVRSNALAFANLRGEKIKMEIDIDKDTVLNLFSSSLISNYLINHLGELDSAFITKVVRLGERRSNAGYSEGLLTAASFALYADGQVGKAFQLLERVTFYSNNQGKNNNVLALWALDQHAPEVAQLYLDYAIKQNFEQANQTLAVATAESGNTGASLVLWDSLRKSKDSIEVILSKKMIHVLSIDPRLVNTLSDEDKYTYSRYRIHQEDSAQFMRVVSSIADEEYRARTILDRSVKLFQLDETDAAIRVLEKIRSLKLSDQKVYDDLIHFQLMVLAKKGDLATLAGQMNKEVKFDGERKKERIYFTALLNQSRDTVVATKNFEWLASANPFFDDGVLAASDYFRKHSKEKLKSYNLLSDAIQKNTHSVKLLKAFCLEAARFGLDGYVQDGLERLKPLISEKAYQRFVDDNRSALFAPSN